MADNNQNNNKTASFDKGLNVDIKDYHSSTREWTFARNAIPNSITGDIGDIGSEPANVLSIKAPYTIIGFIYLFGDTWAVFSTDDTNSEIGRFVESTSTYTTVVNDSNSPRLNFNRANLIIGVSKENFDCTWYIYWSDGNNPDRTMNFDSPPFLQNCVLVSGCQVCTPVIIGGAQVIDTDAIRLAKLVNAPCLHIIKGATGGSLLNGSYFVVVAYLINGQRVTDFFTPSNVQPLFEHSNVAGSIDVIIDSMDTRFDEFELVVVSVVNQQTSAKRFGIYNTRQKQITIDIIDPKLTDVPLSQIPIHNPIADKSDGMYTVGNYLVRVGPTNKFDFNYQPLANQIVVKWQSVEYPADYYRKGGNNTSRLRDENYCEFIQWIYDDGDVSSSFHIPGRPAVIFPATGTLETDPLGGSGDSLDPSDRVFEVFNTASIVGPTTSIPTGDGGFVIQEGLMGYWESTELYPDDKPEVYNASAHPWSVVTSVPYGGTAISDYDLCGKPIRHHKFPEQRLNVNVRHFISSSPNFGGAPAIRIMGTKYENILQPKDNNGNPIPGIVGYRILRGSREGNKTIVAKGIINNMFQYVIEGGATSRSGLYPNYPYNDVNPDPYISLIDTSETLNGSIVGIPNPLVRHDTFTFHSPDTQFKNPFLSMKEVKVYGQLTGAVLGNFIEPNRHPKHKFVTDVAFISAVFAGIGIAVIAANGQRTTTRLYPSRIGDVTSGTEVIAGSSSGTGLWDLDNPTTIAAILSGAAAVDAEDLAEVPVDLAATLGGQAALTAASGLGLGIWNDTLAGFADIANIDPGTTGYQKQLTETDGDNVPTFLRVLNAIPAFVNYWSQGTDATLDLIRSLLKWEQHALQYQSHCLYDGWINSVIGSTRRTIGDEIYLDDQLQDLGTNFRVNNLFRGKSVAIQTTNTLPLLTGDNSKQTLLTIPSLGLGNPPDYVSPLIPFRTQSTCYYTALKNRIRNQYGQIGGIQQIPINTCTIDTTLGTFPFTSPVIFGGDTYVSRYTEKNTMFFFYDWLYGQPDGYEFNYHLKKYVPFPMYWMDTQKWDVADVISGLGTAFTSGSWSNLLPQSLHAFDRQGLSNGGFFGVKDAYIYLSNSGVRDFYVESDVNTDLRDWGDNITQRHYDPYRYTDEKAMFDMNPDVIKAGNYFKYDYSLSISKLFPQFISWANIQPINYDPAVYASCYVHNPNLVIYSLPSTDVTSQQAQLIRDNWTVFLANNYKYFQTPVTSIEPINKSGAIFFFGTRSPQQMVGVDTLRLGSGADATVGTGVLFSQPLQNLITAENAYEYGSSQNRLSVANTPMGIFWISQSSGKIFQLQGGIQEISMTDLKWWFAQYLPYMLTQSFPDFELQDNPVIGIGCQTIFDNENTLVYFMKRDFKLKSGFVAVSSPSTLPNSVQYTGVDNFLVGGILPIKLGDSAYFEDASWCAQYDPKTKQWIGWHDWAAELTMPGKNTFLTTKTDSAGQGGIWLHNSRFDLYCNYYGQDAPFEVEFRMTTGQQVNTIRSVELQMENYMYAPNGHDRYLMLEYFFDKAVVHNPEQCSGLLRLNQTPTNDPWGALAYPIINPSSIDILYSKVENKYRFNQFFDVTDDRGEFTNARRMIWNTEANGYVRSLNVPNLNYGKDSFQRKKFRDYNNLVFLRKDVVGNVKILLMLANLKLLNSPR